MRVDFPSQPFRLSVADEPLASSARDNPCLRLPSLRLRAGTVYRTTGPEGLLFQRLSSDPRAGRPVMRSIA